MTYPFNIHSPIMRPAPYQTMRPGMFSLPKGNRNSIVNYNFYGNMGSLWNNYTQPELTNWDKASEWIGLGGLLLGTAGEVFNIFKPDEKQ